MYTRRQLIEVSYPITVVMLSGIKSVIEILLVARGRCLQLHDLLTDRSVAMFCVFILLTRCYDDNIPTNIYGVTELCSNHQICIYDNI